MVKKTIETITFDGGSVCLDFINTINDRFVSDPLDYLGNAQDLVEWAYRQKLVNNRYKKLFAYAEKHPQIAAEFLKKAKNIRNLLYDLFLYVSHATEIKKEHLSEFNKILPEYFSKLKLEMKEGISTESWNYKLDDLNIILAYILKDAYTLLLEAKLERIGECPECGWLFIDKTKNGSRRWCNMQNCGSRAKSLEYYRRNKRKSNS